MKRHALLITVGIIGLLTVSAGVTVATDSLPEDQDIDFDPPEEPDNTSLYEPNAGVDKLSSDSRNVTAVIEASEVSPDRLDELENLGASVQSRYEQHIQVTIEAGASHTYSSLPWVEGIRRPYRGSSDVVSEGVGVINADDLHANGIKGQNVKVGVIDGGGFDLSSSEISSNIAGHKSFKSSGGIGDGSEHGTATAEVVVDVAPDSELYVANFNTGTEYANAVNWMRNQNVDVIVMSASFFGQPYDGGGFISDVADDAVRQDGIVWANSAGNYAKAHWQGSFSNPDGDQWLDFAAGDDEANYLNGGNPLNANDPVWITLNWDDWDQSDQDYDLHLIKASDDSVVASSESSQTGFQRPTESIRTTVPADGKYYAAIEVEDAAAPQKLEMFFIREGETPEHNVAKSSVTAPAAGDSVTSVGAFFYRDGSLEDFSSHGPTNDGRTGIDVVAPDGVSNDAFGSYFGTSAAAPHVGGAAALMLADDASLSPQNVEQKLESTATDIRDPGEDIESGYGKVDVLAAVQQNQAPSASFTFAPSSPDTSDTVSFDASGSSDSDGTIQTYEWDFNGDGTTEATGQTASHSYSNSGTYTVELTVTDDDGATDTTSQTVSVDEPNSAPTASFTFAPSSPGTSDTISFDGSGSSDSDGSIQSYSWDLDDGTTSTGQTTSHSYSSSGTYTVELTVTDDEGATDTTTQTISVAEPNSAPTASFTFSPNNPDTSDTISFDGSGSSDPDGSVTSYEWDFGDGTTATGQSTSHSYSSSGTYTVTLTVTDNEGATDTTSQTVSVDGPNSPPTASFTFSPNSPDTSDAVSFDASGSSDTDGSIQTYDWDFGDGTTATGQSTSHSYSSSGTYTVSLTITDDEGATDTTTQTISVNSPPTASFTFAPSSPSTSDTVTFDASGSSDPDGTIQSYDWDLGDGTTATGETASHSYGSSGTYTVTLTVTDDNGATDTTTQTVTVGSPPNQPPTASFTLSPNNPDTADTVTFDASGSSDPDGTIQTYEWDFDDGTTLTGEMSSHSYSSSGTYTVELTVTDDNGATDTASKTVSVSRSGGGGDATVESSSVTVDSTGETGESSIAVDAENGLSVGQIEISVDTSVAEITSVSEGSDVDSSQPSVTFDVIDQTADSVRIEYANLQAQASPAQDFELAVVELEAQTDDGNTPIQLLVDGLFDANTDSYGTVTENEGLFSVTDELFTQPLPGFNNPPTNTQELNQTLYEDLDGDGDSTDASEAVLLWSQLVQTPREFNYLTQEQINALDWNGDGNLSPADAVMLWSEKVQT
jgi:PKD repeat protein